MRRRNIGKKRKMAWHVIAVSGGKKAWRQANEISNGIMAAPHQ
jgi:hypothetical protein